MQINKFLLNERLSLATLIIVSLLLLIYEINIIPEPVTAFYWFSSAITYQVPLILLVLFIGFIAKFHFEPVKKNIHLVIAAVMVVLLNGCNEVITLYALVASTGAVIFWYYKFRKVSSYILVLYGVNFFSACFLLFGPGIIHRASLHAQSSIFSIISIGFIKFIILHWYFLKEPLWWFLLFFICQQLKRTSFASKLLHQLRIIPSAYLFIFYFLSGLLIYIPVLYVANGSIPLRSENIICFLYSIMLLGLVSVLISAKTDEMVANSSRLLRYRYLLLGILIFCTANLKKVTDTLLSGFLYHEIMEDRLAVFRKAKQSKQQEVTFYDYETAIIKKVKEHYPLLDRRILRDIIVKPPPIIYFENEFNLGYIKDVYGVRKVNVLKN
jgi:hypothetical protein